MKNKIITIFLLALLLTQPIFAQSSEETKGYYVITPEAPSEAIEYAINNIDIHLYGFEKPIYGTDVNDIMLGNPFTLNNEIFIFPVLKNGKIIGLFDVFQYEGKYTGTYSRNFALEFTNILEKTSKDKPAFFYLKGNKIIADINNNNFIVATILEENDTNVIYKVQGEKKVTDVLSPIKKITKDKFSAYDESYESKYLSIEDDDFFVQNDEPICCCYAMSLIIEYMTDNWIKGDALADAVGRDDDNSVTSMTNLYEYIKDTYKLKYYKKSRTFSYSEVKKIINDDRPFYLSTFKCDKDGNKVWELNDDNEKGGKVNGRHALVMYGYSTYSYAVRNPWYTYGSSMPKDTKIHTTKGGSYFKWEKSVTFKK